MDRKKMKICGLSFNQSILRWMELAVLVMFFSGVLIMVNYIAYRHNMRFDLTPDKTYSLAPHTVRILNSLTEDVYATVFYTPEENLEIKDLMELFSIASSHFHYSFLDVEKNPARAEAMGITSYGAGVVKYKGRREKVRYFTEERLTSAIIRLTGKNERIVRFVSGHGEKDISNFDAKKGYSMVKRALESENFHVEEILLMHAEKIPDDTFVLIISGPQKDFFQKELDKIDEYLKRGGRMLLLCDPSPLPNLEKYMQSLNIQLIRDFIIDKKSKLLGLDEMTPIILLDQNHPIAKHMNDAVVFPVCRSVIPLDDSKKDVFAKTGPDSWAERDTQSVYNGQAIFDRGKDIKGPVSVGVVAAVASMEQGANPAEPGLMVVMGNSNFAANHYFNVLGNKDLFLNTVNWLADKKELLSTRTKGGQAPVSMFFLTENENRLVFLASVIIEPAIILLIGIIVGLRRRMKR